MPGLTLYDVALYGTAFKEIMEATAGEITPELEEALDALIAGGKEKIEAACMVVQSLEASADACDTEAKRLVARRIAFNANAQILKGRILQAVDAAFDGKIKTPLFTVWGQTSAPVTTFEIAPDADLVTLAHEYPTLVRAKYELDKVGAKDSIKAGLKLPNAVTVNEIPGTRYLRIK